MFSELSAEDAAKMTKLNHQKIEALHVLNEEKDLSHKYAYLLWRYHNELIYYRLFGVLAELNQCTVKDIYSMVREE